MNVNEWISRIFRYSIDKMLLILIQLKFTCESKVIIDEYTLFISLKFTLHTEERNVIWWNMSLCAHRRNENLYNIFPITWSSVSFYVNSKSKLQFCLKKKYFVWKCIFDDSQLHFKVYRLKTTDTSYYYLFIFAECFTASMNSRSNSNQLTFLRLRFTKYFVSPLQW